ncbi:MAG: right-handed parallel beta-helix repeat-containing protein [Myxococcota bacterium]
MGRVVSRCGLAVVLALLVLLPGVAGAADLVVMTLEDEGPTAEAPECAADCTLRDALRVAAEATEPSVITFNAGLAGEIVLERTLELRGEVTIVGPGADLLALTIVGSTSFDHRVFGAFPGSVVVIRGLTMQRVGDGNGGGLSIGGDVTVEDCVIRDSAPNSPGGAFSVGVGHLTLRNTTLTNNRALKGGAIYLAGGTVVMVDSTISGSRVSSVASEGSAILNEGGVLEISGGAVDGSDDGPAIATMDGGETTVTGASFSGNKRGTFYVYGAESTLDVADATFTGNRRAITNGANGEEKSGGKVTVRGSTFAENTASGGGAILNQSDGEVLVEESTLRGNRVDDGSGGAIANSSRGVFTLRRSTVVGNSAVDKADAAGGIFNERGGVFTIEASTISGNRADNLVDDATNDFDSCGGISNNGTNSKTEAPATLNIVNSTISGNVALRAGGGLCTVSYSGPGTAVTTIRWSTIAFNRVSDPDPDEGGGGIFVRDAELTLEGVILASNTTGAGGTLDNVGLHTDQPGAVISGGLNLSDTEVPGFGADDLPRGGPGLNPLADNGGPTQTHALQIGSPALDAGGAAGCPDVDQRGQARPFDGGAAGGAACDVGAFEVGAEGPQEVMVAPPIPDEPSAADVGDPAGADAGAEIVEGAEVATGGSGAGCGGCGGAGAGGQGGTALIALLTLWALMWRRRQSRWLRH